MSSNTSGNDGNKGKEQTQHPHHDTQGTAGGDVAGKAAKSAESESTASTGASVGGGALGSGHTKAPTHGGGEKHNKAVHKAQSHGAVTVKDLKPEEKAKPPAQESQTGAQKEQVTPPAQGNPTAPQTGQTEMKLPPASEDKGAEEMKRELNRLRDELLRAQGEVEKSNIRVKDLESVRAREEKERLTVEALGEKLRRELLAELRNRNGATGESQKEKATEKEGQQTGSVKAPAPGQEDTQSKGQPRVQSERQAVRVPITESQPPSDSDLALKDDRIKVSDKGMVVALDRTPNRSGTDLVTSGSREVKFKPEWLGFQGMNEAYNLGMRARGYAFGTCRRCATGENGPKNGHWVFDEDMILIPVPGETLENGRRKNGVCVGRHERGQVATHHMHTTDGEHVWAITVAAPVAPLAPQGGVVILGPNVKPGAVKEACDLLRAWARTLYANNLLVDSPSILPHGLDWEPYGVVWDVSGMHRPRARQLLTAEVTAGGLTDTAGYAATVPSFVSELLGQLTLRGRHTLRAGGAGGLVLTDDEHGQLLYVPAAATEEGALVTTGSDMKPVIVKPKVVTLPHSAVVGADTLAQFKRLSGAEPQPASGEAVGMDALYRALQEDQASAILEETDSTTAPETPEAEATSEDVAQDDQDPELG
jgi:hypothetical protein